jgi:hypothetical protein
MGKKIAKIERVVPAAATAPEEDHPAVVSEEHRQEERAETAAQAGLGKDPREIGATVSDADLQAATSDVEGLNAGELALVLRSDGKWTYGKLKKRSQTDMEFIVGADGSTKLYPIEWYCDLKRFVEPEPLPLPVEEASAPGRRESSHERWKHVEDFVHETHPHKGPPDLSIYFSSLLRDDKVEGIATEIKALEKQLMKQKELYQELFFGVLPEAEEGSEKERTTKEATSLAAKVRAYVHFCSLQLTNRPTNHCKTDLYKQKTNRKQTLPTKIQCIQGGIYNNTSGMYSVSLSYSHTHAQVENLEIELSAQLTAHTAALKASYHGDGSTINLANSGVRGNKIMVEGWCKVLQNWAQPRHCVCVINLSNNLLGSAGCKLVCEAIKMYKPLSSLDLSSNKILRGALPSWGKPWRDEDYTQDFSGLATFAGIMKKNRSLLHLSLKDNRLAGLQGGKVVASMLSCNKSLTTLDLSENRDPAIGLRLVPVAVSTSGSAGGSAGSSANSGGHMV